ncbi:MAG TPA: tRNA lysidine(34) synthetase TilS [Candidatus Azoamicus sp. MARI]
MSFFEQNFLNFFSKFKFHKNIYVAYSGGVDSGVLLHLSSKFFNKNYFNVKAVHINHGYSNFSHNWSIFCKKNCDKYKIPLLILNSKLKKKNNIEQEFRFIRFNFFFDLIFKNSSLLLAHNKDDFLETMFLRLFRGSNLFSIFGIQYTNKVGKLNILRPLIPFCKTDIKKFASLNDIRYVSDVSNFDIKFNRNYIRFNIVPLIVCKWENFDKVILKSFIISSSFNTYFYFKFRFFFHSKGFNLDFLSIKYLFLLPYLLRCEIIKLWIKFNNFKTPSYSQFIEVNKLLYSTNDSYGFIFLKDYLIKKKKNYLFIENIVFYNIIDTISIHLKKNNTRYFYFDFLLVVKNNYIFFKNYFIIKFFNFKFTILGRYYNNFLFKAYFLFKVLY